MASRKLACCFERGAQPNAKNREGRGPLCLAARESKRLDVATLLMDKGADLNSKDILGRTALMAAAGAGDAALVHVLLAKESRC